MKDPISIESMSCERDKKFLDDPSPTSETRHNPDTTDKDEKAGAFFCSPLNEHLVETSVAPNSNAKYKLHRTALNRQIFCVFRVLQ